MNRSDFNTWRNRWTSQNDKNRPQIERAELWVRECQSNWREYDVAEWTIEAIAYVLNYEACFNANITLNLWCPWVAILTLSENDASLKIVVYHFDDMITFYILTSELITEIRDQMEKERQDWGARITRLSDLQHDLEKDL